MKKVLIGCGIIALIAVLVVVSCTGFLVFKAKQFTSGVENGGKALQKVETDFKFTPPDDQSLDEQRLIAFLAIRDDASKRIMEIPAFAEIMKASEEKRQAQVGMGDVFKIIGQVPKVMEWLAERLRKDQMSPGEYVYIAKSMLTTIQKSAAAGDPQMVELWDKLTSAAKDIDREMAKSNQNPQMQFDLTDTMSSIEDAQVPAGNIDLLLTHKDKITGNVVPLIVDMFITSVYEQVQLQHQYQQGGSSSSTVPEDETVSSSFEDSNDEPVPAFSGAAYLEV